MASAATNPHNAGQTVLPSSHLPGSIPGPSNSLSPVDRPQVPGASNGSASDMHMKRITPPPQPQLPSKPARSTTTSFWRNLLLKLFPNPSHKANHHKHPPNPSESAIGGESSSSLHPPGSNGLPKRRTSIRAQKSDPRTDQKSALASTAAEKQRQSFVPPYGSPVPACLSLSRSPLATTMRAYHSQSLDSGVFNVSLDETMRLARVDICTRPEGSTELVVWGRVPAVVAKWSVSLISAPFFLHHTHMCSGAYLKDRALEIEGIFRVPGSTKRMRDLQNKFEAPPKVHRPYKAGEYVLTDLVR